MNEVSNNAGNQQPRVDSPNKNVRNEKLKLHQDEVWVAGVLSESAYSFHIEPENDDGYSTGKTVISVGDVQRALLEAGYSIEPVASAQSTSEWGGEIERMRDMVKIQCSNGNYDYNSYMHGMANGMILFLSLLENTEPEFMKAPDTWLDDLPQGNALTESTPPSASEG